MKHCRPRRTAMAFGLAALAMMVAATNAHATAIRFDNPAGPGHYDWGAIPNVGDEVILSILDGPADQTAVIGDSGAFRQRYRASGTDVRRAGALGEGPQYVAFDDPLSSRFLVPLALGETIPTPIGPGIDCFTSSAFIFAANIDPAWPSFNMPEGQEVYLGVRFFDLGGGADYQYGWIGVVRTGIVLDAFAWGYETDPGVSIPAGAPEPGTLAMLAFGAAALLKRRRPHASQIDSQID